MAVASDIFFVGSAKAAVVPGSEENQSKIYNAGPGALFYKNASDVDTEDTEIEEGASATLEETVWIISASESHVFVTHLAGPQVQDIKVTDDITISSEIKGGPTWGSEGSAPISAPPGVYAGGWNPAAATSGTNVEFAEKKLFMSSLWLPCNKTLTGIGYLVGETGEKGKVVVGLFNTSGEVVAKSSETTEGTAMGEAAKIQEVAFTSTYAAKGPALYFIGVTANQAEGKFRAIPANTAGKNIWTKENTLAAKNTLATATAPSAWTADKGPIGFVY